MSSTDTQNETAAANEAADAGPALAEDEVRAFLLNTPDFFERHPELLMRLKVTHDGGGAVSLVERKLRLLNDELAQMRANHHELVQIARDNAALHTRVYALALDLISAADLESLHVVLTEGLMEDFRADAVTTWVLASPDQHFACVPDGLRVVPSDAAAGRLMENWLPGGARCGRFSAEILTELFGNTPVGSAVVLPLEGEHLTGLVAIGALDPARFADGLATDALEFLVAAAAVRMGAWLVLDPE